MTRMPVPYIMGILALLFVGGLLTLARLPFSSPARAGAATTTALELHWEERIRAVGPATAYVEFGDAVKEEPPTMQHEGAHAFGGALYEVEGTKGLSICDSNFNFGCYHEFLGRAIATLGLASVGSLNQGCVDALQAQSLSCQHGIGHGILAYLGYDQRALLQGLEQCRDLPHNDPIGGCYGGLFMEYNLQTMLSTEGRIRPLGANPLEPCDSLDKDYRQACYYWQPQWWSHATNPPMTGSQGFAHMGAWCETVGPNVRDCFEGLGNIASPESNFTPSLAKTLCEATSQNTIHQLYCKSIAANSLTLGGGGMKGDGLAVCAGLMGEQKTYCEAYARNESNILDRGQIQE